MDRSFVLSRIESLSEKIQRTQPSEVDVLARIHTDVSDLAAWAKSEAHPQAADVMDCIAAAIEKIILADTPDPVATLQAITQGIVAFQTFVRDGSIELGECDAIKTLLADADAERIDGAGASQTIEADIGLIRDFVSEAREHLHNSDIHLLTIETSPHDIDALNAIFRAFHTIKGVAGFLALGEVQALAHESENLLDLARKGELVLTGGYVDLTFDAIDMMKRLIDNVERAINANEPVGSEDGLADMVQRLKETVEGRLIPEAESIPKVDVSDGRVGEILLEQGLVRRSKIEAVLQAQSTRTPSKLGELLVEHVVISRRQLNEALEIQRAEGGARKLGEILVSNGVATWEDINRAIDSQEKTSPEPIGAMLVREGEVAPRDVVLALRAQQMHASASEVREAVKVDAERLDRLVDLIGELVIAESILRQSEAMSAVFSPQHASQIDQLGRITRELQELGTSLSMVPIRATFQKMSRLVRDLGKKTGKQVQLITEGEETELDKSVVDQISDPLMHMVRNAIDHGLEASSADRIAVGKPAVGRVTLRASHKGSSIHIDIEDDGRGLDRNAILAKARERGLVQEGRAFSDSEIFSLIFQPGFSTAQQVTDISGRGVGLDVVRRNIELLRGKMEIRSEPGQGSTFSIRLPLTHAVIDGMLIRAGSERYIVPTLSILRSLKPGLECISTVAGRGEMLTFQEDQLPLIRLHELFAIEDAARDPQDAIVLLLENEGRRFGLLIDELIGQQQIVIRSLGDALKGTEGIAGAAILPDGTVGLVLDVSGIMKIGVDPGPGSDTRARRSAA